MLLDAPYLPVRERTLGHQVSRAFDRRDPRRSNRLFRSNCQIAARVQQLAGAGEMVLSADVYGQPGVTDLLASFDVAEESGIMKGVEGKLPVFRVRTLGN